MAITAVIASGNTTVCEKWCGNGVKCSQIVCLNEANTGSAKHVFRSWAERLQQPAVPLDSNEDDAELLITIPFNGTVKVKAISIIGGGNGSSPARLRAYTNRNDLDFAAVADMAPIQAWDLQEHQQASMEYPTQCVVLLKQPLCTLHLSYPHAGLLQQIHVIPTLVSSWFRICRACPGLSTAARRTADHACCILVCCTIVL